MDNNIFQKPPLTIEAQLKLLSSRGMVIQDIELARHYLKFISYYRFCGYAIEYEDVPLVGEKRYHSGTTFEQVLDCYIFDRKLRLLVIDAIERIEVAIRTVINNELSMKYGAHWYLNKDLFLKRLKHNELIQTIKRETLQEIRSPNQHKKRERFIQHYFDKYNHPELPPSWMIAEVLSLGAWSIIFSNLINREDQKIICRYFGVNYVVMTSWLRSLTYLRNLCAHHSKLWSRKFTLKPLVASSYKPLLKNNSRLVAQAAILKIFLDVVSPDSNWIEHLHQLIAKHPKIDIQKMGFERNWFDDDFWKVSWGTSGALIGKELQQSTTMPNKREIITT